MPLFETCKQTLKSSYSALLYNGNQTATFQRPLCINEGWFIWYLLKWDFLGPGVPKKKNEITVSLCLSYTPTLNNTITCCYGHESTNTHNSQFNYKKYPPTPIATHAQAQTPNLRCLTFDHTLRKFRFDAALVVSDGYF